jgi:hypothetical protein
MLLTDLIGPLQLSIGPVILISGVGLIILSLTNRLGRIVDRTRQLSIEYRVSSGEDLGRIFSELKILTTRAKVIRGSNTLAVLSVLFVSLIIISLFASALYNLDTSYLLITLFTCSIISLIIALALFIYDIELSLKALWIELPQELN